MASSFETREDALLRIRGLYPLMVRSAAKLHVSNQEATIIECGYFGNCFGIMAFSFSRSMTFIFMPPGIMMSPGF